MWWCCDCKDTSGKMVKMAEGCDESSSIYFGECCPSGMSFSERSGSGVLTIFTDDHVVYKDGQLTCDLSFLDG